MFPAFDAFTTTASTDTDDVQSNVPLLMRVTVINGLVLRVRVSPLPSLSAT